MIITELASHVPLSINSYKEYLEHCSSFDSTTIAWDYSKSGKICGMTFSSTTKTGLKKNARQIRILTVKYMQIIC